MHLLYYGFSSVFALGCCLPGVASKTLYPSDGTTYIDALVTTNRFCPVRCAKEIFQPESTEDLAKWMRTEKQKFEHITVKGGGHSYSCQSVPIDGQALIHTERLNKVEVVTRKDGTAFARLGAGLTTLDVVPGLHEIGYSMPHGQCLTVGLAGWLLNLGNHPETNIYANFYETPFLKKITGVDYDGNIVTIDKNGLSFVDRSPSMSEEMLMARLQNTTQIAKALDIGLGVAGRRDNYPSESIEMRIMQYWGASLMVATEFEIELLNRKEPPYLVFLYDISLFREENNDMLRKLYRVIKDSHPAVINCGLHFSQNFMEGGGDAIGLQCVDFQDENGANARKLAPKGFSDVRTYIYGGFLAWNNDSYGTGWLPSFFAQPSVFLDEMNGLERWRQAILKLSSTTHPCTSCAYQMSYIHNLDVNMIDLLCSAPPEFQNACNSFASEINTAMINDLPKRYKQNLPFCEATTNRTDETIEYTDGLYNLAMQAKMVWDMNNTVDFWLGVGHEGQDDQCEAIKTVGVGHTCAANSITIDDLVKAERRAIMNRCPDFFEYDSMAGINAGCDQHLQKQAKKSKLLKKSKRGKKGKKEKN